MKKLCVLFVFLFLLGICLAGNANADPNKAKRIVIWNTTNQVAQVNIDFGAESGVNASNMGITCNARGASGNLNCRFDLQANTYQELNNAQFKQVNGKVTFNKLPGCGASYVEWSVNMADSKAQDVINNSIVDGFNEKIAVSFYPKDKNAPSITMGPACGQEGNQNVYGVYPFCCDNCKSADNPQKACCGNPPYNQGRCHKDTKPICQYQLVETSKDQLEAKGILVIALVDKNTPCDTSGNKSTKPIKGVDITKVKK